MDDIQNSEKNYLISHNYDFPVPNSQSQVLNSKYRVCKRFGFKKILFLLAILLILCVWVLYNLNFRKSDGSVEGSLAATDASGKWRITPIGNSVFHLPLTQPKDMIKYYIEIDEDVSCLAAGVDSQSTSKKCSCLSGWSGMDCGIPYAIWDSGFLLNGTAKGIKVQRREQPKRIVYSIWFDGDYKLLRRMLKTYHDIVDVFLIGRYVDAEKGSEYLFPNLVEKYDLSFAAAKIIYIPLPYESNLPMKNIALAQYELWKYVKKVLSDVRPDDLILMSDVYNLPTKEVLAFFKLYDGYSEPAFFYVQLTGHLINTSELVYGNRTGLGSSYLSPNIALCTVEFLRYLCNYDTRLVWLYNLLNDKEKISVYEKNMGKSKFSAWNVGSPFTSAGVFISDSLSATSRNFTNLISAYS